MPSKDRGAIRCRGRPSPDAEPIRSHRTPSAGHILVEALNAWFNCRNRGQNLEALEIRAAGIERKVEALSHRQGIFWEAFARMLRHQLALATVLPKPDDSGRASAAGQFENFIDQMAQMLAGKDPLATDDPAIES